MAGTKEYTILEEEKQQEFAAFVNKSVIDSIHLKIIITR
jgi:hypothetical protein